MNDYDIVVKYKTITINVCLTIILPGKKILFEELFANPSGMLFHFNEHQLLFNLIICKFLSMELQMNKAFVSSKQIQLYLISTVNR